MNNLGSSILPFSLPFKDQRSRPGYSLVWQWKGILLQKPCSTSIWLSRNFQKRGLQFHKKLQKSVCSTENGGFWMHKKGVIVSVSKLLWLFCTYFITFYMCSLCKKHSLNWNKCDFMALLLSTNLEVMWPSFAQKYVVLPLFIIAVIFCLFFCKHEKCSHLLLPSFF